MEISVCTRVTEKIKEPCSINEQPSPKQQIESSNTEKKWQLSSQAGLSGQGWPDNPAPSKNFLSVAAAYNLIDREDSIHTT
jgi:hypothetical protein